MSSFGHDPLFFIICLNNTKFFLESIMFLIIIRNLSLSKGYSRVPYLNDIGCVPVTQKQRLARPFIFLYNPLRGLTTSAVCSHGADLLKTAVLAAKEEFPKLQLKFCFLCIRGGGVMSY